MHIDSKIKELLEESEIEILEKFGNLLEGLSNGTITPTTKKQEKFVEFSNSLLLNPIGVSEKVWKKYNNFKSLIDKQEKLNYELKTLSNEIKKIKKELNYKDFYIEFLEEEFINKTIDKKEVFSWDQDAFDNLSVSSQETLKMFEKTLILKNKKMISKENFDRISIDSGLDKIINEYEKIRKSSVYDYLGSYHTPKIDLSICDACGTSVLNGYCKCSS